MLTQVMEAASGVPLRVDVLKRTRASAQQVGLPRAEPARNVAGAFRVPADRRSEVRGCRFVLVDDVLTPGATIDTCARALLRAGAAQVDASYSRGLSIRRERPYS